MRLFPRNDSVNGWTNVARAQAKRERKAAKRRRDAELTQLGAERRHHEVVFRSLCAALDGDAMRRGHDLPWVRAMVDNVVNAYVLTSARMRAIRRGEVQP